MADLATVLERAATAGPLLACPQCAHALALAPDGGRCAACGLAFPCVDGIWRLLTPPRERARARFVAEYRQVRRAEGWGSDDPAYYRALPETGPRDPRAAHWRIRAASLAALSDRVVAPLERALGRPLSVLDLGSGNGWLSARLASRGHRVAAVDLSDDPRDGLGAHRHYEAPFVPVQADFDALPFPDGGADLAVFNASLHYAPECSATLAEALRVLRPAGRLVVMDTPFYRNAESGARMVREREAAFLAAHGFRSDAAGGEGFLTYRRLAALAGALGVRFRLLRPRTFWPMAAASLASRLAGRRETSVFPLAVGARP